MLRKANLLQAQASFLLYREPCFLENYICALIMLNTKHFPHYVNRKCYSFDVTVCLAQPYCVHCCKFALYKQDVEEKGILQTWAWYWSSPLTLGSKVNKTISKECLTTPLRRQFFWALFTVSYRLYSVCLLSFVTTYKNPDLTWKIYRYTIWYVVQ